MFRLIRVPPSLDQLFRPWNGSFHGDHCTSFRLLVVGMAVMWGRRHVANLDRDLEAKPHRPRFHQFLLVARWAPVAALRQQAQEWVRALRPAKGETSSWRMDDAKPANRGKTMAAVATRNDPTLDADIRGHQDVCGRRLFPGQVLPGGLRLSGKTAPWAAVALPCQNTTALAAPLLREFPAPVGVQGLVLVETSDRCPPVVTACRDKRCHVASTVKSHRRLFTPGWQLTAGRSGRQLCRRRRTASRVGTTPHGRARCRVVDAGGLTVSSLGPLPVVFARNGAARKSLGLVTDAPERSAAGLIQADDRRWDIAPWITDPTPRLGLGHDQPRSSWAAVTPRQLVCVASALLTHRRLHPAGAPGHRRCATAADLSTATAQDQRRCRLWEDLRTSLKEEGPDHAVIEELKRLHVA